MRFHLTADIPIVHCLIRIDYDDYPSIHVPTFDLCFVRSSVDFSRSTSEGEM